ncbi:MAG: hypothetical protein P8X90_36290, partial [Desulfobacterales bacterium]
MDGQLGYYWKFFESSIESVLKGIRSVSLPQLYSISAGDLIQENTHYPSARETELAKLFSLSPFPSLATRQLSTALRMVFSYFSGKSEGNSTHQIPNTFVNSLFFNLLRDCQGW